MSGGGAGQDWIEIPKGGVLGALSRYVAILHEAAMGLSTVALIAACVVLSSSVALRYFFKEPTDWQDEVSVFLLVGATFLSAGYVQQVRGHIGIEAIASLLPDSVNRIRARLCDLASLVFCAFFTYKSWMMCFEAWSEGQTTSSSWAPPLWIPYGLMCVGMTLLVLQFVIQVLAGFAKRGEAQ
jgi:TRAP-type C4-dicarboxylate transport system permease small subunit